MKLWADFHPYVLPDVFGCPEPLLDQVLREVARDFCTKTKAWKEWIDPMTVSGSRVIFEYETDAGTEVVTALEASIGVQPYSVLGSQFLPAGWETGEQGCVKDYTLIHINSKEFVVYPTPVAGDVIKLKLALRPTMSGSGVGDVIYEEFTEAIAAGTKAKLMAKPRKEWTDLQMAVMFGMEFERRAHSAANVNWRQTADKRVTKVGM